MKMLYIYAVQYGSHEPQVAVETRNVANVTDKQYILFIPIKFNLNIHLGLVTSVLDNTVKYTIPEDLQTPAMHPWNTLVNRPHIKSHLGWSWHRLHINDLLESTLYMHHLI